MSLLQHKQHKVASSRERSRQQRSKIEALRYIGGVCPSTRRHPGYVRCFFFFFARRRAFLPVPPPASFQKEVPALLVQSINCGNFCRYQPPSNKAFKGCQERQTITVSKVSPVRSTTGTWRERSVWSVSTSSGNFSNRRLPTIPTMAAVAAPVDITIRKADLALPEDRKLLIYLLNEYAEDPMGGGESLSETTKETLAHKLHNFPTSHVWFAYCNGVGCGLCTCFEGFSTFAAKRLINIHDMAVLPSYRSKGIASRLMAEVERFCQEKGDFCKITLEVLSNNHPAKSCYVKCGFAPYELGEEAGHAEFWQKKL